MNRKEALMKPRVDYRRVAPGALQPMMEMEKYLASSLDPKLIDLLKLRASIVNGCAFCIDMHSHDARILGETDRRMLAVAAWDESSFFTDQERAALAWTDAVTKIGESRAPDAVWEELRRHFDEKQCADLTFLIATINSWNRIAIALRSQPPEKWPNKHVG
jgi:AhpD family alkylhydroperoxidase